MCCYCTVSNSSREHQTGQASIKGASLHPACMQLHASQAGSQMGLWWSRSLMDATSPHLPWCLATIMRTWLSSSTCLATSSSIVTSGLTRPACCGSRQALPGSLTWWSGTLPGPGLLEVKCLYKYWDLEAQEAALQKGYHFQKHDNVISLRKNSPCNYQIQC